MARATKRRKIQPQRYTCHTCMVSRISSQFPNSNPTSTCKHLINTCKRCLKAWVESQIETSVFTPHIACPECDEKMGREDVEGVVTKRVFARYVELERVYIAENTPGWRWCLAPGCGAGQVHVPGKVEVESEDDDYKIPDPASSDDDQRGGGSWSQDGAEWATTVISPETIERLQREEQHRREQELQQEEQEEQERQERLRSNPRPDIFKCEKCGAKACVPCDRPWHTNESCGEYQLRIKDRIEEEDATIAAIQRETKSCPSCSKHIFKIGGCKHMHCTQCGKEFCWVCMHLINQGHGQYCGCNDFRDAGPEEDPDEDEVAEPVRGGIRMVPGW